MPLFMKTILPERALRLLRGGRKPTNKDTSTRPLFQGGAIAPSEKSGDVAASSRGGHGRNPIGMFFPGKTGDRAVQRGADKPKQRPTMKVEIPRPNKQRKVTSMQLISGRPKYPGASAPLKQYPPPAQQQRWGQTLSPGTGPDKR